MQIWAIIAFFPFIYIEKSLPGSKDEKIENKILNFPSVGGSVWSTDFHPCVFAWTYGFHPSLLWLTYLDVMII